MPNVAARDVTSTAEVPILPTDTRTGAARRAGFDAAASGAGQDIFGVDSRVARASGWATGFAAADQCSNTGRGLGTSEGAPAEGVGDGRSTGATGSRHDGLLTEAGVAPATERAPAALERLQTLEDLDIENEHWLAAFEGDDDDDALLVISQSQSTTDYVWVMSCNSVVNSFAGSAQA